MSCRADEVGGGFAGRCVRDRGAQPALIDAGLTLRPRQQRLRKGRVLWPARVDLRERRARLIGPVRYATSIVEQPELADEVDRGDATHLSDYFLDVGAPVERSGSTMTRIQPIAEVGIERHQLARRTRRILRPTDLVEYAPCNPRERPSSSGRSASRAGSVAQPAYCELRPGQTLPSARSVAAASGSSAAARSAAAACPVSSSAASAGVMCAVRQKLTS